MRGAPPRSSPVAAAAESGSPPSPAPSSASPPGSRKRCSRTGKPNRGGFGRSSRQGFGRQGGQARDPASTYENTQHRRGSPPKETCPRLPRPATPLRTAAATVVRPLPAREPAEARASENSALTLCSPPKMLRKCMLKIFPRSRTQRDGVRNEAQRENDASDPCKRR